MADEIKSNLEPIEEKDLDLGGKFRENSLIKNEGSENKGEKASEIVFERKEGVVEKDESYAKILSKVKSQTQAADDASVKGDAMSVSEEAGIEEKINSLVNLAMQKGIPHAVKVARHLEDNYVLDEIHDRLLADELHDALVKKGMLEEI
jgi:hypothetical protein